MSTISGENSSSPAASSPIEASPEVSAANGLVAADTTITAGFMAGVAKSLATKSAFAATAFGKGLLKWWFRVPIKLFRPHTVSPYLVVNHMAQAAGQKVSMGYMRTIVAQEGYGFLGKNVVPLLFANAMAGAVLFNVYASTYSAMAKSDSSASSLASALEFDHHYPFIAGALAGASTAIVATPIENIKANINPADLVAHRHEGMIRFTHHSIRSALKNETSAWDKSKRLYQGFGFLATKDAVGFGLFFFFFENLRKLGKGLVADMWGLGASSSKIPSSESEMASSSSVERRQRPLSLVIANATAVILAGGAAGSAYQCVIYPLDKIPAVVVAHRAAQSAAVSPHVAEAIAAAVSPVYDDGFHNSNPSAGQQRFAWSEVWQILRQKGVRPFYAGITPSLIRVMPPSAIGLFAYEVASSQFWDNDEV
ncbi:mitochondrial carrier domain-containing protein [Phlyctochytrium arcticum]|nr:mitochondrial carrier domain-containing protein [Phlyctochytrium arcticum]